MVIVSGKDSKLSLTKSAGLRATVAARARTLGRTTAVAAAWTSSVLRVGDVWPRRIHLGVEVLRAQRRVVYARVRRAVHTRHTISAERA